MTLPSSGPLTFAQIQAEIDGVGAMPITIPNADWRTLAGKPTGALVIPNDFWGKSWNSLAQTDDRGFVTGFPASFSSVDFGADATGRRIVVLVYHGDVGSNPGTAPTCTIGGVSATRHIADTTGDGAGNAAGTAIFSAAPAGTSGTVSVTWGNMPIAITVLRLTGYSSTPHHAVAGSQLDANKTQESITINVPANGALIANVSADALAASGAAWTNARERLDIAATKKAAWDTGLGSQSGRVVTCSWSGARRATICGVTFASV